MPLYIVVHNKIVRRLCYDCMQLLVGTKNPEDKCFVKARIDLLALDNKLALKKSKIDKLPV